MPQDKHGYLIVSHEVATGADCDGCLMVVVHGGVADLVCNSLINIWFPGGEPVSFTSDEAQVAMIRPEKAAQRRPCPAA